MPTKFLKTCTAVLGLSLLVLSATGCTTTAKLNNFAALSKAGIAYVDAADSVIDTAAAGSIEADTSVLLVERSQEDRPEKRRESLKLHSEALRTQLGIFSDIRRHQSLLKDYFVSLGALAEAGDADSAIGDAAKGVVSSLGKVSPPLESLKFGDQEVGDFVSQGTRIVVAAMRSRALEDELKANGAAVNKELMISEGLMAFLAAKIIADDKAVQGPKEFEAVSMPYVQAGNLSGDWPAKRSAFLKHSVDMAAVSKAQDAARKLRTAFVAASENHLAPGQLQLLVEDLSTLTDLLENVKGKKK